MERPPDDHDCGWKTFANDLESKLAETSAKLDAVVAKMEAIERKILGRKSEKLPPVSGEVRKERPVDPAEVRATRRKNAELRATKLVTEQVKHVVPEAERRCPKCHGTKLRPLGEGKKSSVIDYIPGYFRRREHVRETLACPCGQHVVTAPGPEHAVEGARYGDSFRGFVTVSKCADSIPGYRQAKQLSRLGIPISRSTLTDLLHQTARELEPLSTRLLELVAASDIVQADETSLKMQKPNKRGFVWTFLSDKLIAYRFSASRSGETPSSVLGASQGTLLVDMYTGYNEVTGPGGRVRAACLAHARRRFFEALEYAPEARTVLEMIRDVYVVEHDAKAEGIAQTEKHTALRKARSRPIMDRLHAWLRERQDRYAPKSPMATAVRYALNNWSELTRFLDDARLPPDNNRSESALRIVALGRKNFLFVGHEEAGQNLAGLYSLVATCEANGVEPIGYLTDVLGRVRSHPAKHLDDLLPHKWRPPS